MIGQNSRFVARADVFAREFDGETVLVDLAGGDYFGLDGIGGHAWRGFVAGRTPAELAEELCARYEVAKDDVLRDLVELAGSLVSRGLLSLAEGPEK